MPSSIGTTTPDPNDDGNGGTDPDPTDDNKTDPVDDNKTDPVDDNTTDPVIDEDYGPSTYDPQACLSGNGYTYIRDNSFDPDGYYDEANGLKVTSYYPKTFNAAESEVRVYHPGLDGTVSGAPVFKVESRYSFSFDKEWVNNANNTIYVKTPLDVNNEYFCFRYKLNSTDRNEIKWVLVHNTL